MYDVEPDPYYTILEVCHLVSVSKATVYKWIYGDDTHGPVFPRDAWIKLPGSGYIRIKGATIVKLMNEDYSSKG